MARDPGTEGEPSGGRQPTGHEIRSGRSWDASYTDGPAPWDIGGPQPAVMRLASRGAFTGTVLDAGCGTGENTLHIAALGLPVVGFDIAETAVATAREKAERAGIGVEFVTADARDLGGLGRRFDTVLDCGLFHSFDPAERPAYLASLAGVTEPGATLYLLCFSDQGAAPGPHPVTGEELRAAFDRPGWRIDAVDSERLETRFHEQGAPAWSARIERVAQSG
ncbi:class I SAM-dependent methyltransferase [Nocardia sp. NPDC003345]